MTIYKHSKIHPLSNEKLSRTSFTQKYNREHTNTEYIRDRTLQNRLQHQDRTEVNSDTTLTRCSGINKREFIVSFVLWNHIKGNRFPEMVSNLSLPILKMADCLFGTRRIWLDIETCSKFVFFRVNLLYKVKGLPQQIFMIFFLF